ncbi:MAG: hypothetical protein ACKVH8_07280 [Pirellulales bacterium]|jgi:hypothetical protein
MNLLDVELVVVVVKYRGEFHWYRSDRDLWVLDWKKWRQDFVDAGSNPPTLEREDRFGIPVVKADSILKPAGGG